MKAASVGRPFTAMNGWISSSNIRYFEFPELNTGGGSITSYRINYPPGFPQVSFVSERMFTDNANTLSVNSNHGIYITWGDQARFEIKDQPLISENTRYPSLVAIPVSGPGQQVQYLSFSEARTGVDRYGNYKAILLRPEQEQFGYEANIAIQPTADVPEFDYEFDVSGLGSGILFQGGEAVDIIYSTYAFLTQNFRANAQGIDRTQDFEGISQMWQELDSLSRFEFAYSTAVILQANGLKPALKYGYVVSPNLKGFNTNQPHIWVEVVLEGQIRVIDPYLSTASGYQFINMRNINRVEYGTYIPGIEQDMLGITSEQAQRPRGAINELTKSATPVALHLEVDAPATVSSGLYYDVGVKIINAGGTPTPITGIFLNNENIAGSYLTINNDFQEVVPPFGRVEFDLIYLREPNLLSESLQSFTLTLLPESEDVASVSSVYTIKFQPNPWLLGSIFAVVVVVLIVVVVVLVYLLTGQWLYYFGKRTIFKARSLSRQQKRVVNRL